MSGSEDLDPLDWILKVTSLLSEDWQRDWVRDELPFLTTAQWAGSRLVGPPQDATAAQLDRLVDEVLGPRDTNRGPCSERVAVFILADWEHLSPSDLECILTRLSSRFPGAQIQALPLHREGNPELEILFATSLT